jgi:hypothetical protein
MRLSRFRGIQSALERYTSSSPPLRKWKMRECSRKRSTTDTTSIDSLTPLRPGRRQQIPRTASRILTPASPRRRGRG